MSDTRVSEKVSAVVDKLFGPANRETVLQILRDECSDKLPLAGSGPHDRIQLAVLKLSAGNIDKFLESANLARRDWRDVLVWAGFGNDLDAHNKWAAELTSGSE